MFRHGEVKNYSACKKECGAKHMHPFEMLDFYNFADQLTQTNFLFHKNQTTENQMQFVGDLRTVRTPIFQTDENFELCTNVQYDFERRIWADDRHYGNALRYKKFDQLWVREIRIFNSGSNRPGLSLRKNFYENNCTRVSPPNTGQ